MSEKSVQLDESTEAPSRLEKQILTKGTGSAVPKMAYALDGFSR
jgi:hypothetical protein